MPGPLGGKRQIGQLRHMLELQSPVEVPNKYGAPVKAAWTTEATIWGNVQLEYGPGDGGELPRSGGVEANFTGTVTIRLRTGVTPKKRLVWKRTAGDLVLNIVTAPPAEGVSNFIVVRVKSEA